MRTTLGIALILSLFVLEPAAAQRTREDDQVELSSDLVEILVTCLDRDGKSLQGLDAASFDIRDNGRRQTIAHFSSATGPVGVGVILDTTGMPDATVERALDGLRVSRLTGESASEVAFAATGLAGSVALDFVGTSAQVLPDVRFGRGDAPLLLREAIRSVEARLDSRRISRRLVIVITEGSVNIGPRSIANDVEGGHSELYAVFASSVDPGAPDRTGTYPAWQWWKGYTPVPTDRGSHQREIVMMAERSGGRALWPRTASRDAWTALFDRIAGEVEQQYAIGFYPSARTPGWHRISVQLTDEPAARGVYLGYRKGYAVR